MATAYALDARKDNNPARLAARLLAGYFVFLGALLAHPILLPFAAVVALVSVARQGPHPHNRDSVGFAFLPFAYASVEVVAALGAPASVSHAVWLVAVLHMTVFAFVAGFFIGQRIELTHRSQPTDRRDRLAIARTLARIAITLSLLGAVIRSWRAHL